MRADVRTLREAKALKAEWEGAYQQVASIMAYEELRPTRKGLKPVITGYRVSVNV